MHRSSQIDLAGMLMPGHRQNNSGGNVLPQPSQAGMQMLPSLAGYMRSNPEHREISGDGAQIESTTQAFDPVARAWQEGLSSRARAENQEHLHENGHPQFRRHDRISYPERHGTPVSDYNGMRQVNNAWQSLLTTEPMLPQLYASTASEIISGSNLQVKNGWDGGRQAISIGYGRPSAIGNASRLPQISRLSEASGPTLHHNLCAPPESDRRESYPQGATVRAVATEQARRPTKEVPVATHASLRGHGQGQGTRVNPLPRTSALDRVSNWLSRADAECREARNAITSMLSARFGDDGAQGSVEDAEELVAECQRHAVLMLELKAAQCAVKAAEFAHQRWSTEPPHRPGYRIVAAYVESEIQEGKLDPDYQVYPVDVAGPPRPAEEVARKFEELVRGADAARDAAEEKARASGVELLARPSAEAGIQPPQPAPPQPAPPQSAPPMIRDGHPGLGECPPSFPPERSGKLHRVLEERNGGMTAGQSHRHGASLAPPQRVQQESVLPFSSIDHLPSLSLQNILSQFPNCALPSIPSSDVIDDAELPVPREPVLKASRAIESGDGVVSLGLPTHYAGEGGGAATERHGQVQSLMRNVDVEHPKKAVNNSSPTRNSLLLQRRDLNLCEKNVLCVKSLRHGGRCRLAVDAYQALHDGGASAVAATQKNVSTGGQTEDAGLNQDGSAEKHHRLPPHEDANAGHEGVLAAQGKESGREVEKINKPRTEQVPREAIVAVPAGHPPSPFAEVVTRPQSQEQVFCVKSAGCTKQPGHNGRCTLQELILALEGRPDSMKEAVGASRGPRPFLEPLNKYDSARSVSLKKTFRATAQVVPGLSANVARPKEVNTLAVEGGEMHEITQGPGDGEEAAGKVGPCVKEPNCTLPTGHDGVCIPEGGTGGGAHSVVHRRPGRGGGSGRGRRRREKERREDETSEDRQHESPAKSKRKTKVNSGRDHQAGATDQAAAHHKPASDVTMSDETAQPFGLKMGRKFFQVANVADRAYGEERQPTGHGVKRQAGESVVEPVESKRRKATRKYDIWTSIETSSATTAVESQKQMEEVVKCTRNQGCVRENRHRGTCKLKPEEGAATCALDTKEQDDDGPSSPKAFEAPGPDDGGDTKHRQCPRYDDCVNPAGHRGRCKRRTPKKFPLDEQSPGPPKMEVEGGGVTAVDPGPPAPLSPMKLAIHKDNCRRGPPAGEHSSQEIAQMHWRSTDELHILDISPSSEGCQALAAEWNGLQIDPEAPPLPAGPVSRRLHPHRGLWAEFASGMSGYIAATCGAARALPVPLWTRLKAAYAEQVRTIALSVPPYAYCNSANDSLLNRGFGLKPTGRLPTVMTSPGKKGKGPEEWALRVGPHTDQVLVRPKSSTIHGLGLFTTQLVAKGSFITELIGECITAAEAQERAKQYLQQSPSHVSHTYQTFGLNHDVSGGLGPHGDGYMVLLCGDCVIDATVAGSLARFINHSPTPNAEFRLLEDGSGGGHVCIFALRDIVEGAEVTVAF